MTETAPAPRLFTPATNNPSFRAHARAPRTEVIHDTPGWIYVEMWFDRVGDYVRGHAHTFDHDMLVMTGALRCVADGVESIHRFGSRVTIPAGVQHELWALESGTMARCLHEIRAENGEHDPHAFSPEGFPVEWLMNLTHRGWKDSAA